MDEVSGELDNVAPAGADRSECCGKVGKGLGALRLEIVATDEFTSGIDRDLTGDEDEFGGLDSSDLRIGPRAAAPASRG